MLGYGPNDDVSALTIAQCHPEWARRLILEQGLPAAMRDGYWTGRTAVAAADGREIPMLQVILCHRNAQGHVTHLSTIARDLTELERTEAERRTLELSLGEAQKMESIGTLAGGVAHDFNNVLAAILGNVAIARRDLDPGHPSQRSLALIHQAAARARALVQQIMTFSRRSPQELTVQALRPLVEESVAMLRATLACQCQTGGGVGGRTPCMHVSTALRCSKWFSTCAPMHGRRFPGSRAVYASKWAASTVPRRACGCACRTTALA